MFESHHQSIILSCCSALVNKSNTCLLVLFFLVAFCSSPSLFCPSLIPSLSLSLVLAIAPFSLFSLCLSVCLVDALYSHNSTRTAVATAGTPRERDADSSRRTKQLLSSVATGGTEAPKRRQLHTEATKQQDFDDGLGQFNGDDSDDFAPEGHSQLWLLSLYKRNTAP